MTARNNRSTLKSPTVASHVAGRVVGSRPKIKPKSAYHHGDLRRALLAAAEGLLAEKGLEGVTLRECARRAGVSHGAPAHHFGDVGGLLSEFTAISFVQLDASMRAARRRAPAQPIEQLIACGIGYVDYGIRHPARFRLMFRAEKLRIIPSLVTAGDHAYGQLHACMVATDLAAGSDGSLLAEKIALAWTIVHGFTMLMLDNAGFAQRIPTKPAALRAFVKRMLMLAVPGFEHQAALS